MKTITIDASCAASWLFVQQRTQAADRFFRESVGDRLVAPDIFAWEIGNLIVKQARRADRDPDTYLQRLGDLGVRVAAPRGAEDVLELVGAASGHGLSLFDAAYLRDALARAGWLATRDGRLIEVARAVGVDVFDLRD